MSRLTIADAAKEKGCSQITIRRAIASNDLHASQRTRGGEPLKGAHWKVESECLDAWDNGIQCPHKQNVTPILKRQKRAS